MHGHWENVENETRTRSGLTYSRKQLWTELEGDEGMGRRIDRTWGAESIWRGKEFFCKPQSWKNQKQKTGSCSPLNPSRASDVPPSVYVSAECCHLSSRLEWVPFPPSPTLTSICQLLGTVLPEEAGVYQITSEDSQPPGKVFLLSVADPKT